jgi:hypothetical protein
MEDCRKEGGTEKSFNVPHCQVEFFHRGGLTVRQLFRKEREFGLVGSMEEFGPDVVAVILGDPLILWHLSCFCTVKRRHLRLTYFLLKIHSIFVLRYF